MEDISTAVTIRDRRMGRLATDLALTLERMGKDRLYSLLHCTLDHGGAAGDAVRALVRLSQALAAFAEDSVIDDHEWRGGPESRAARAIREYRT